MENLEGKTIIYLTDIASPASQAGKIGQIKDVVRQVREVGLPGTREISNFATNTLLRGGHVRVIEPSEIHAVRVELGTEEPRPKPERKPHVRNQRVNSTGDQESNPGKKNAAGTD